MIRKTAQTLNDFDPKSRRKSKSGEKTKNGDISTKNNEKCEKSKNVFAFLARWVLIYNQEIRGCFFLSGRLWFECEGKYDLLGGWPKE